MEDTADSSKAPPHRIDAAAKLTFLTALRAGTPRDEAAREAGFTATVFYYAREQDPLFRHAWLWANELSAADEHAGLAARAAPGADAVIAPNANRRLQVRRVRRRRFDDARKRLFLDHFAGTADAHAAAAAAGVGYSTPLQHRRTDPDFAAAWDEALEGAYAQLEAEAVRQRLEAAGRLRETLSPTGEIAKEFDRVMQLLVRYRRPDGRIALREVGRGRERRWSFDEAIHALDQKLRALGARHGIPSEPIALPAPPSEEEK
jgi:hypothetical protein